VRERTVATNRKPAKLHRKDIQQQKGDNELRRGDRQEARQHQAVVDRLAPIERRDDAKRQAYQKLATNRRHQ